MTTIQQLVATFKAGVPRFGGRVYQGTIPESAVVPACAIYNVAFSSGRVLSGKKTGNASQWRVTVVDTVADLQSTIDAVELLDNTQNQYFQRLWVQLSLIEPKAPTEPHQRAFIDVTVYPK